MNDNSIKAYYQNNIDNYTQIVSKLKKTSLIFSIIRGISFLLIIAIIFLFFESSVFVFAPSLIISIALFLFLIRQHNSLVEKKEMFEQLLEINKNELKAQQHDFSGFENGKEFIPISHDFAEDIDILGEKSLYQILNRCGSFAGKKCLANWFLKPLLSKKDIDLRQKAVEEFIPKTEFRQKLFASTKQIKDDKKDFDRLLEWVKRPNKFNNSFFKIATILTPIFSFSLIGICSLGLLSFNYFILFVLIAYAISGAFASRITKEWTLVGRQSVKLKRFSKAFQLLEKNQFSSPFFKQLEEKYEINNKEIPGLLKKLSRIVSALDGRLNFVVWLTMNALFLWDILQILRLEKWKKDNRNHLENWLNYLAEIESINSLSTFAYNHSEGNFPEILENQKEFVFQGEKLGHPLIPFSKRVCNSICINDFGIFDIITGANMAGKSTYLRTIGVNLILAQIGSVVIGNSLKVVPVNLFTGIKVSDSLQDGESYFFAELKRLQQIIQRLEKGERLFVLLDEILRGTNSEDKKRGSIALIEKLVFYKTSGIIATHDLSLGTLKKSYPKNIQLHHFNFSTKDGEMLFDYTLKEGIAKDMNASLLLKQMGII